MLTRAFDKNNVITSIFQSDRKAEAKEALELALLAKRWLASEKKPPLPVEKADDVNKTEDVHVFM